MKTEWDYTSLADAYIKRPDYSKKGIEKILRIAGIKKGDKACDIGAGVGHLTIMLAQQGLNVTAVEPNDAMRQNGIKRTSDILTVSWFEGTAENSGQASHKFDLVTFGSSFNVTDRLAALKETERILKPLGWFACMWNHRDLQDPIQASIEGIIKAHLSNYSYGTRREDQTEVIDSSGLFEKVQKIESPVIHKQSVEDCVEAWRSHATLQRQAGSKFKKIVEEIEHLLVSGGQEEISIPYMTNIWIARLRK